MSGTIYRLIFGSAGVFLLAGCASVPKDAEFGDVQRLAAERTGHAVQWDGHTIDDRSVREAVQSMLGKELTADEAVQIALLNNHSLQATFEDLGIAQADLVQAGLLKNPVFDLGVRVPTRPPSNTYVDLSVAEDFINVFFLPARRKLAEAQFQQVKARVSGEVLNLAADTKSAFFSCQSAQQLAAMRRVIAETTAASAALAQRLHDAGNSTTLDLLSAKARDERARLDLANADADAADAREKLNELMGLSGQETNWTMGSRLPDLPAVEVQPAGLEIRAIRQRADLAAARQEVQVQAQALGFTSQTRLWSSANVGVEGERETDGQWRLGPSLAVPVPLFDQGQAAIPRAQAMLRQSEQRLLALTIEVRSQVRMARTRLLNARNKALLIRDQLLPLQQQVVDQTQLQYNGMLIGVFQLLQAKQDQVETEREYNEAMRDYWIARAELERAVGGRLPGDATTRPSQENQIGARP